VTSALSTALCSWTPERCRNFAADALAGAACTVPCCTVWKHCFTRFVTGGQDNAAGEAAHEDVTGLKSCTPI